MRPYSPTPHEDAFVEWMLRHPYTEKTTDSYKSDARKAADRINIPYNATSAWFTNHEQDFAGENFSSGWAAYCRFRQERP